MSEWVPSDWEPNRQELTDEALDRLPARLIEIRRRSFKLIVWYRAGRGWKQVLACRTAIGASGFATPKGPHTVLAKESPPSYTAPDSKWARDAGYEVGQTIPPGDPANPLLGAFLWLTDDGIGIHGTANRLSLGTRASHGCVRVSEEDAVRLYRLVPVGTAVLVV